MKSLKKVCNSITRAFKKACQSIKETFTEKKTIV